MDNVTAKPPPEWLDHLHETGQWERLEQMARKCVEIDPTDVDAHGHLTWALLKQGRYVDTRPHIEASLNDDPECADIHLVAAFTEWQKGRRQSAWQHIKTAMGIEPKYPSLFYLAANFYEEENELDKARTAINAARALDPEHAGIARLHVDLHIPANGTEERGWERVHEFEQILAMEPDSAELHECLGDVCLKELNLPTRAETCFRQALSLKPNNAFVQEKLRQAIAGASAGSEHAQENPSA